ncbi:restriction endonuclease subunit S [Vibrio parahaemolyticus]|uniref:restriction endonuclease subunit S n=1 Tax=Vibrio TaxID=662 RepID=UPI0018F09D4F|nr:MULTISPECIES: restriction endonuclease subunit S [Vibrio]EKO3766293.1 restriction endonuclease subunit S [Vibrio metschnikovii]MDG2634220.1 restriction endonuclease subunit S [Vibrio parahaemolyticus]EGR2489159.1 restriction endonuclease subunit S [Vibrio cholerae]EGR2491299.1 restriction endonuclease subunit S [Vibrio cholerae]EGR4169773.1 restriction endonuclease subunit S [Vibrio cholerae]
MVPNGWKLTSLGEICSGNLQTGPFGSQLHAHEYMDEGVPVLMPKDLINYRANNESAAKIPEHRADDLKKHTLKSGDLLFSRRGDVARFALIESDYPRSLCGTGCLKATPSKDHSPLFLSYFLQKNAVKKWLEQNAVGQTMPNMNTAILSELPLMVASSREEEDKIAQILSTWDKAITTTERLIATSQQQKKALMQQLLTGKKRLVNPDTGMVFEGNWERHSLSDLVHVDKKSLGKKTPDDFEFKYISLSDVATGTIGVNLEIHKYSTAPSRARRVLQNGDILLSTVRPNLKGFAKISEKHADCIASTGFSVLTPKKRVSGDYIYQYIFSSHVTGQINSLVVGSNYPAINSSDVAGLKVYCPTYEEQQKIASVLTAADKEIELLEAKLAHLKDEKKALMQQLLTGKRRVQI